MVKIMQYKKFGTNVHKSDFSRRRSMGDNCAELSFVAVNDVSGPREVSSP